MGGVSFLLPLCRDGGGERRRDEIQVQHFAGTVGSSTTEREIFAP